MLAKFLQYVGALTLVVFGGLFILTLFAPIPSFGHWFGGAALFQAVIVLFGGVVGVMGLHGALPPWRYRGFIAIAIVLAVFAWWQAAEQSASNAKSQAAIDALKKRGEGSVDAVGKLKGLVLEGGEWLVKQRIHITGSNAQTGVVLRFYGNRIKEFRVFQRNIQNSAEEPYKDGGEHYAHYIRRPIGLYDLEIKFAKKAPIQFTYKFEDGRPESKRAIWAPEK